jgi:hypothetical protein
MRTSGAARILAALSYAASTGIVIVVAIAVITALAGGNVMVWIDSGGLPSIESGSAARMVIPVSGTLTNAGNISLHSVQGLLRLDGAPGALRVTNTAIVVLLLAVALWILRQFTALFRALRAEQFFLAANAVRVRRIGWAVILGELARAAIVCFENSWAMQHVTVAGLRLESHFQVNAFAIVCGVMILALAEVFREGARLDREASLTI